MRKACFISILCLLAATMFAEVSTSGSVKVVERETWYVSASGGLHVLAAEGLAFASLSLRPGITWDFYSFSRYGKLGLSSGAALSLDTENTTSFGLFSALGLHGYIPLDEALTMFVSWSPVSLSIWFGDFFPASLSYGNLELGLQLSLTALTPAGSGDAAQDI